MRGLASTFQRADMRVVAVASFVVGLAVHFEAVTADAKLGSAVQRAVWRAIDALAQAIQFGAGELAHAAAL